MPKRFRLWVATSSDMLGFFRMTAIEAESAPWAEWFRLDGGAESRPLSACPTNLTSGLARVHVV